MTENVPNEHGLDHESPAPPNYPDPTLLIAIGAAQRLVGVRNSGESRENNPYDPLHFHVELAPEHQELFGQLQDEAASEGGFKKRELGVVSLLTLSARRRAANIKDELRSPSTQEIPEDNEVRRLILEAILNDTDPENRSLPFRPFEARVVGVTTLGENNDQLALDLDCPDMERLRELIRATYSAIHGANIRKHEGHCHLTLGMSDRRKKPINEDQIQVVSDNLRHLMERPEGFVLKFSPMLSVTDTAQPEG